MVFPAREPGGPQRLLRKEEDSEGLGSIAPAPPEEEEGEGEGEAGRPLGPRSALSSS